MTAGHTAMAVESLLWSGVCMESSIPLLTVKFLCLRVDIYTSVCQCYFHLREPRHAELFARRGLEKIHELALLEHQSSSQATQTSERVFRQASLKMSMVVFRRSVLESRITKKPAFRPKKRPSIRELLQQLFPRSPTEKLLSELFIGDTAQFMAVLEALVEPSRASLEKGLPRPITNLDADTTSDVIQELLCAGTDLAIRSLQHLEKNMEEDKSEETVTLSTPSLLEASVDGLQLIPLGSILHFVRMAISYDQREVLELLLNRSMNIADTRLSESEVHRQYVCIQLLLLVEAVRGASGGRRVTLQGVDNSQHALIQEPGEKLIQLSTLLHSACKNTVILELERDLIQDCVLFLWETIRPAFSQLHTHHTNITRPLTSSRKGKEYAGILKKLVDMAGCLKLWRSHILMCGELILKYGCLVESSASCASSMTHEIEIAGKNDRALLLQTQAHLERGIQWISLYRASVCDGSLDVSLMHSELLYALTRVRVKLASTILPSATPEMTQKLSSLPKKVLERQKKVEQRQVLLTTLTAQDTPVKSLDQLRTECGRNHYHTALLAMLESVFTQSITHTKRVGLLKEAVLLLEQLGNKQSVRSPSSATPPSSPTMLPPSPILLQRTPTTMTFKPAPWHSPYSEQVAYYRLYGRLAEGSNVKVRLSDKGYPGLGTEVPAGHNCTLIVRSLQPNTEYVFAVAAYSKDGQILGHQQTGKTSLQTGQGSIGETGRPIVACHSLPVLVAWSYCCQCAYVVGARDAALKAADVIWTQFIDVLCDSESEMMQYKLKTAVLDSTNITLLYHFIYTIFIYIHLTSPPSHPPPLPRSTQLKRIDLCNRLLQSMIVCEYINEPSLSLQAVVMCYGLLAPLLQRDIATPAIAIILIHCHCTLCEMSDLQLIHTHTSTQIALHHIIASSAFHLNKMLLKWRKVALFSSLVDNTRGLLLLTMPATPLTHLSLCNPETAQLDQSWGSQAPSLASYVTASSGLFPGLVVPRGAGGGGGGGERRKRGRKKTTTLADQITDETKSREYRAYETFTAANCNSLAVPPQFDSSDITGQEDPLLLHIAISTMPAIQAQKEVHKFRRRPQYLEYFVYLIAAGMEQGQQHLVLEWAQETFTWLARRNEIILTSRPVHVSNKPHTSSQHNKHSTSSSSHTHSKNTTKTTTTPHAAAAVRSHSTKASSVLGDSHNSRGGKPPTKTTPTTCKTTPTPCKALVRHSRGGGGALAVPDGKPSSKHGRRSVKGRCSLLNEKLTKLLALEGVVVTREDLMMKATSVLQTLLPVVWRNHKCRKRIREIASDELPWRSQANIYLTQCHLHQLLKIEEDRGSHRMSSLGGAGGGMIDRADIVPTYPPVTPGYNITHRDRDNNIQDGSLGGLNSPQTPQSSLGKLTELMCCIQRAVVLAQRGRLWVLVQNACRCLWNAINALVSSLPTEQEHQISPGDNTSHTDSNNVITEVTVYGLASKPLYMAMESILDLLTAYYEQSLQHSNKPIIHDRALEPDFDFLRQFMIVALRVMSAQGHWESVVSVGLRLYESDVKKMKKKKEEDWMQDELSSLILNAHSKLVKRVEEHSTDIKREGIQPAAHLDPGPDGHDIYGVIGQALARVCVPLDPQIVLDNLRIEQPNLNGPMQILKRCRKQLAGYLTEISSLDDHTPLNHSSQLPLLISNYNEAIQLLERGLGSHGDDEETHRLALACTMNDLGNLYLHEHNTKLAGRWWERGLCHLLRCKDLNSLKYWKEREKEEILKCGIPGTMLAAILATKLARFTHASKVGISLQYLLMATKLFKSIPVSSLPHQPNDISFLPHSLITTATPTDLPTDMDLFNEPFIIDPVTCLDSLQYCGQELVDRKHAVKALPVLWLYWYIAYTQCRSPPHTMMCRTLQLKALIHLHMYSEAVSLLGEILSGYGVPQTSCSYDRPIETSSDVIRFNDSLPISHPTNIKALRLLMSRDIPTSIASECGREAIVRLSLARADLYTALGSTYMTSSSPHILTTNLNTSPPSCPTITHLTPPITHLTPPTPSLSTSSGSQLIPSPSPSSTRLATSTTRTTSQRHLQNHPRLLKTLLVEQAENILKEACHSLSSLPASAPIPELRVQILISLARLSLTIHHTTTATKLSLAGLRTLQAERPHSSSVGVANRLWLQCRQLLAQSLVGKERNTDCVEDRGYVIDCAVQCEDGLKEAEKMDDCESTAEFHFTAALHALSHSPPDSATITKHAQTCLHLISSFPSPSPSMLLLHARCTLLLCDVGCREGHVTSHDAIHIYQKLVNKLKDQISGVNACSPYHPIHLILSHSLFHLSLSISNNGLHCRTDDPVQSGDVPVQSGDDPVQSGDDLNNNPALTACKEGLDILDNIILTDPCLTSNLLSQQALLLWKNRPLYSSDIIKNLLQAINSISQLKIDYRKQFTSCFEVAWLLSEAMQNVAPVSPVSTHVSKRKISRSTATITTTTTKKTSSTQLASEEVKKPTPSEVKSKKDIYMAWCCLKTAQHAHLARETFKTLTSQLHHPELAKTIPDKALTDIPEFVLLECDHSNDDILTYLLTSKDAPLPIDILVPSAQMVQRNRGLTWFKIVAFTYSILSRCFWPSTTSDQNGRSFSSIHSLTSSLYTRYYTLISFLHKHCPLFATSCTLPSLPPSLIAPLSPTKTTPGGVIFYPQSPPSLRHLQANDREMTIVWYKPSCDSPLLLLLNIRSRDHDDVMVGSRDQDDDIILGVFGFNQKALKQPKIDSTSIPSVDVFNVHIRATDLEHLKQRWEELSDTAQNYLDSHLSGRPVSRSPSRLRKQAEKTQQIQAGLQVKLEEGVKQLCDVFGRKLNEGDELPHLEPHVVSSLLSIFPRPTQLPMSSITTTQGDIYHFLNQLFYSTKH